MGADALRAAMVTGLLVGGRIRTPAVERAFRAVPRHLFLPDVPLERAYLDEAVPIKWQHGVAVSSASQPSMMAIMLEQLELCSGHRVLEVGTGTGYNAALMAELVGPAGSVTALDIDDDLTRDAEAHLAQSGVQGVFLATRDGALGYPERAPYDRIVLTVGSWDIQPAWWRELAPGGRLLLPLSVRGSQLSVAFDLVDDPTPVLRSASVRSCAFVRLRGRGAGPELSRPVAEGLAVQAAGEREPDTAALLGMLSAPGPLRPTSVRLGSVDLWDGLGLWLAAREPDACRLLVSATSPRYRSLSLLPEGFDGGTMALLGDDGLAVIVPPGQRQRAVRFPVGVRPFGPGGRPLADRLVACLRQWLAAGRPAAAQLRLRVHLGGGPAAGPAGLVSAAPPDTPQPCKPHSRLELDWPVDPMGGRPKLDR